MQRTKLISLLVAAMLTPVSFAHAAEALSSNEQSIESPAPVAVPKTTIGRLSQKQLELYELELDAKIADVKAKKANAGMSNKSAALPDISMPTSSAFLPSKLSEDFTLSAIFGRTSDLQAELIMDGNPFVVKKGSTGIPGWRVVNITSDRVVLNNGKRTKEVYLTTATDAAAPAKTGNTMPGLPPIGGVR